MNFTLGNINVHIFDAMLTFNANEDEKHLPMLNRLNRMRYIPTYAC